MSDGQSTTESVSGIAYPFLPDSFASSPTWSVFEIERCRRRASQRQLVQRQSICRPEVVMPFAVLLTWIGAGLLVGFIVSKVINLRGDDPRLGIAAAVVGAVVAGILYSFIAGVSISTWTPWCLASALIGAVAGVFAWHLIRSRSITREKFTARRSY
jgi:uncharacterized membrane protein YeaQ/YmgE (transglycosylase-associated protein family)